MADAFYVWHKNRGQTVLAVRVVNGAPLCSDCFEGKEIPVVSRFYDHAENSESEVTPVAKEIDWAAVQAERDRGVPVAQLETKYGVPKHRRNSRI